MMKRRRFIKGLAAMLLTANSMLGFATAFVPEPKHIHVRFVQSKLAFSFQWDAGAFVRLGEGAKPFGALG